MPTEHFGTCPECYEARVFPVTETDHGDVRLECDCGRGFWITPVNPMEEP